MKKPAQKILTTSILLAAFHVQASAAMIAYWRFEDGPNGGAITSAADSTGNAANTLTPLAIRTTPTAVDPTYVTNTEFPNPVPETGDANNFAATGFSQGGSVLQNTSFDFFKDNRDPWTLEFFGMSNEPNVNTQKRFVTLGIGGYPVMEIKLAPATGRITWAGISGSQFDFSLTGGASSTPFHFALVHDTDNDLLNVYFNGALAASSSTIANPRVASNAGIIVGGFAEADLVNGWIDELRISDTILAPSQFLNAIPEPGVVSLLGIAGCAIFFAGRRKRS
ncbi:MAG: LamG-like jellyroll fold domain-containing protein [Chthoniobacterales bacterium]